VNIARGSSLDEARRAVNMRERRRTVLNWAIASAASLMLIGGVVAVSGGGAADALIASDRAADTFSRAQSRRDSANSIAVEALDREIARAGLSGLIDVERNAVTGQLRADGEVTAEERRRWNAIAQWFDAHFGGELMLQTDIRDRDTSVVMPFQIISVVMSPNPRIVIENGRIFPVGSTLPGGWEVVDIADMKVVLAKGNREVKIAF
jgi:hypothetical protein